MGHNAGAFGSMTFPSAAARVAWNDSRVDHARWSDWVGALGAGDLLSEQVSARLARLTAAEHEGVLRLTTTDLTVELTFDTGSHRFEETAGTLASALRAADRHGAVGRFLFLATLGAEEAFVYELTLGEGSSTCRALAPRARKAAYGKAYDAFSARVGALMNERHPALAELDRAFEQGTTPRSAAAPLHLRVMSALAELPDAALTEILRRFPHFVPGGRGLVAPKTYFKVKTARATLAQPLNEELRAAALFALCEHAPRRGVPLALEALEAAHTSSPVRVTALEALRHAEGSERDAVWPHVARAFTPPATDQGQEVLAAAKALRALEVPQLEEKVAALVRTMASCKPVPFAVVHPMKILLEVVEHRELDVLDALANYAIEVALDPSISWTAEVVLRSGRKSALAILARGFAKDGVGVYAATAALRIDADAHHAEVTRCLDYLPPPDEVWSVLFNTLNALAGLPMGIRREPRWQEVLRRLAMCGDEGLEARARPLVQ